MSHTNSFLTRISGGVITGLCCLLCLSLPGGLSEAHDYVPGAAQQQPIVLKGGDLYTVSQGILPQTDLLFENGRITAIGVGLDVPEQARVIDVSGKRVYPGLIAPYATIGLVEIGSVRATNDRSEVGMVTPEVQAHVAYNPDSEIIPSVRSEGVTTALIVPSGRLLLGRSSLINLDGWTVEDAAEKLIVGVHLKWPQVALSTVPWEEKPIEDQKREMREDRKALYEAFDDAHAYYLARRGDAGMPIDIRWEAMRPLFDGTMPLFVYANDYRQIEQAVDLTRRYDMRMILVGGSDAWMCRALLEENNIPVIVSWVHSLPSREDESYDLNYSLPARLAEAGITVCLAKAGGTGTRNLPFQAGQAIAYGLAPDVALRSMTLTPAELFGVADDLGSLEVGKKATLIVSDGDIFDIATHNIVMEFIAGREVDLDNKHKELLRKYRQKRFLPTK